MQFLHTTTDSINTKNTLSYFTPGMFFYELNLAGSDQDLKISSGFSFAKHKKITGSFGKKPKKIGVTCHGRCDKLKVQISPTSAAAGNVLI